MSIPIRLSLVGRSRARAGEAHAPALHRTTASAPHAEALGSHPFWVPEHVLLRAALDPAQVDLGIGRTLCFTVDVRGALRTGVPAIEVPVTELFADENVSASSTYAPADRDGVDRDAADRDGADADAALVAAMAPHAPTSQ